MSGDRAAGGRNYWANVKLIADIRKSMTEQGRPCREIAETIAAMRLVLGVAT